MKFKTTFFTVLMYALPMSSEAQTITAGLEAGLNIAREHFSPANAYKGPYQKLAAKSGLRIGALVSAGIARGFSAEVGLFYSQKGVILHDNWFGTSTEGRYRFNYVEIPVYAKYSYKGFFGAIGPYVGIAVGASVKGITIDTVVKDKIPIGSDPTKDGVKRMDAGLNIKAGYCFPFGLFFTPQFSIGLMNTLPGSGLTGKYSVFSLNVGYNFCHLKSKGNTIKKQ